MFICGFGLLDLARLELPLELCKLLGSGPRPSGTCKGRLGKVWHQPSGGDTCGNSEFQQRYLPLAELYHQFQCAI
jgi:hypothetical protein